MHAALEQERYRGLQQLSRALGLPAKKTTSTMRGRLRQKTQKLATLMDVHELMALPGSGPDESAPLKLPSEAAKAAQPASAPIYLAPADPTVPETPRVEAAAAGPSTPPPPARPAAQACA